MQRKLLLICLLLLSCISTYAQEMLKGQVLNKKGEPVPGATVTIKGTTAGSVTDADGRFNMQNVKGQAILVITATGYRTLETTATVQNAEQAFRLEGDVMDMGGVVVTGSSSPRRKLESSVAITTISSRVIEQLAPTSTADLMKSVPGFVVETSGGEVGNNLFARGIPSAGAYEFVQIQEDGMPVFEDGALQFANADNWLVWTKTYPAWKP